LSSDVERLLLNLGYRLINARYGGMCVNCGLRYEAGVDIYWKRDENKTYSVCPKCYSNKNGAKGR
jgi:DNA-directed RNA polymerase subunit RPC12/RpoP